MSRRPCRFWGKPEGCNKGNRCPFSHGPATPISSPPTSPSRPRARRGGTPTSPAQSTSQNHGSLQTLQSTQCPNSVCRDFWGTGQCKKGLLACSFRHISATSQSSPQASTSRASAVDAIVPFLSEGGLTKMVGAGTDGFYPTNTLGTRSPIKVHNSLGRFMFEHFHFKTTFDIYAFQSLITSASASDPAWVCSQLCLLEKSPPSNLSCPTDL